MPRKCSDINASKLNKVVSFIEKQVIINPSGFKEDIEVAIADTRALVKEVSFKEVYKVDKLDLILTKKFITRYNQDLLNSDLVIKYQDNLYRIKYIEDLEEARRFLVFICEQM